MIRTNNPRSWRTAIGDAAVDDYTLGCGQPPTGITSGTVCAGTGTELSCQLCPHSPGYRKRLPPTPAPPTVPVVAGPAIDEDRLDWSDRGRHVAEYREMTPCRHCGGQTFLLDDRGRPSHKVCAEKGRAVGDHTANGEGRLM